MKLLVNVLIFSLILASCSGRKQLEQTAGMSVDLLLPSGYTNVETAAGSLPDTLATYRDKDGVQHTIGQNTIDEKTGEQLLTIGLQEVKVTARFKNVSEREGNVKVGFNIHVPSELMNDNWELFLFPVSSAMVYPGIVLSGENFLAKQVRQYDYYAELCKVIIPENDLDQFVNRKELEKALARHNRDVLRRSKLKTGRLRKEEYSLVTSHDTAEFISQYMNSRLVNRNEYFKRVLAEKKSRFITLPYREGVKAQLVAPSNAPYQYSYVTEIPATEATGRINLRIQGEIRTINGDIYPVSMSDSLVFVVSTLRSFIKDTIMDSREYKDGMVLLKRGQYRESLEILRPFADWNTAVNYLVLGYDRMAYNLLLKLPETADNLYLRAIAAMRLENENEAVCLYTKSCDLDNSKKWRGNLDPEISSLISKYKLNEAEF